VRFDAGSEVRITLLARIDLRMVLIGEFGLETAHQIRIIRGPALIPVDTVADAWLNSSHGLDLEVAGPEIRIAGCEPMVEVVRDRRSSE
jgi:hypothetical protein